MSSRRSFLRLLGIGAAVAPALPAIVEAATTPAVPFIGIDPASAKDHGCIVRGYRRDNTVHVTDVEFTPLDLEYATENMARNMAFAREKAMLAALKDEPGKTIVFRRYLPYGRKP